MYICTHTTMAELSIIFSSNNSYFLHTFHYSLEPTAFFMACSATQSIFLAKGPKMSRNIRRTLIFSLHSLLNFLKFAFVLRLWLLEVSSSIFSLTHTVNRIVFYSPVSDIVVAFIRTHQHSQEYSASVLSSICEQSFMETFGKLALTLRSY